MEEKGWLIESDNAFPSPRWLRVVTHGLDANARAEIRWTDDAATALRFGRREDARGFAILHSEHCVLAKITEHVWAMKESPQ